MSEPTPPSIPLAQQIDEAIYAAESLEAQIASAAQAAGRGPEGLALNVAKTQIGLGVGMLLRAQRAGAAVGSG